MNRLLIVFYLAVCGFISSTHAQEEPSYEETLSFIVSKYKTGGKMRHELSDEDSTLKILSPKKCTMKIIEEIEIRVKKLGNEGNANRVVTTIVELKEMDPTKVIGSLDHGHVQIYTLENRLLIEKNFTGTFDKRTISYLFGNPSDAQCSGTKCKWEHQIKTYDYKFFSSFINEPKGENSLRVEKAFKHLIKLCGGKGELF